MACKVSLQSSLATLIAISVANSGNGSVQVAGRCIAYVRPATRIPSTLLHLVPMPAWEQRKLGEIVSIGAGAPPSAFSAGNFLYVKVDDLNESSHFQFDSAQRVDANTAVKPIRKGSIIFAKRGAAILGNKVRVLGKTAYIDTNMMALEPRGVDADFLWLFINQTGLYRIADTSTIPQINNKHIEPYPVDIPNMAEQQAIGTFFSRLDDLITLHQRKYDKLVIFKKSMLEKMFPKDGESVPEIRFAGFTDPWEQRKLGELEKDATLYMGRGRVISAKDMSNTPGTFPVYSSSALDNGRMGAYGKYMFNQELITWSIDGGGAVFYRRKHRFSVTNVSGYIAVNPEKINCKFLAYAMSLAHSRIKFDYTVKAHPSVIRSLYTMGIPISLQEQQVIGSFFSRLDDLITLHQRKRQWLKWLDEGGEGTHHDIDILVFKFADDMKISVLCGVHACMTKSLGHTGNRYAGKQQQRGMGVP